MGTCHCTTVEYPDAMQYTTEQKESSHQFEYLTQRYYMEQEHLRKHMFPSNEISKSGRRNSIANKTDHSFATTQYEDKYEEYLLEKDSQYDSTSELQRFHPLSRELKEEFDDSHTTPQGDPERRSLESDLYLPDEDIKKLEQYFSASDSGSTSIVRISPAACFALYPNLNESFAAPNVNADKRNENSVFRKDPAKIPLDILEESQSDSDRTESTITGWRPITAKTNKITIVNL